jgi:hypothetical protein
MIRRLVEQKQIRFWLREEANGEAGGRSAVAAAIGGSEERNSRVGCGAEW